MSDLAEVNFYTGSFQLKDVTEKVDFHGIDEAIYACNLSDVESKYKNWIQKLPRIRPYYAVKCNNDPMIIKKLIELGSDFDCASKMEIKQIIESNGRPEQIIFANPCKPVSHLQYAKDHNVTTCTVDNEFEIYKISKYYENMKLLVRFRSEADDAQCPLGDKFGCDAENDAAALILLADALGLTVAGTSFHVGSGCNDLPAYERAIKTARNIFEFGDLLGCNMDVLDIGGGFPGSDNEKFSQISDIINAALEKYFPDPRTKIIAEPGRYFVASAYTLICKIHAKREVHTNGRLDTNMYYLNDGIYGSFNCILYDHQEITAVHLLDKEDSEMPKFRTVIWGPTCDSLDKIVEGTYLPNLACGDLIAFHNMGAYTLPVASTFNGFLLPRTLYFEQKV